MKILFCNYEYPPLGGGGGVINALLAEELAKKHDVTVLTSQRLGLPEETVANGVKIIRLPVLFRKQQSAASLLSLLSFVVMGLLHCRQFMKNREFDVVNTHFVLPTGPVGQKLATFAGIPNVLTVHGGDLYDPSKTLSPHRHLIFRIIVRWLLKKAASVIGQSNNTIQNTHDYYIQDLPVRLIPLGINRPPKVNGNRDKYKIKGDETVLVTVGRLVKRKGLEQLIKIFGQLKNKKLRLVIIGSGPQEQSLKQTAIDNGVAEKIIFTGFVKQQAKLELLDMADIYVSTSQHEGFGLVFLEGMAAGLPVVCYDYGGQTDFLENGKTGYLVKLNDTDSFKNRLIQMINAPDARKK